MEQHEWRELMRRFEQHLRVERGLAGLTVRNYRTDLEPLFDFMLKNGVPGLKALDRAALRAYLAWLIDLGYVRRSVRPQRSAHSAPCCGGWCGSSSSTPTRCPGAA